MAILRKYWLWSIVMMFLNGCGESPLDIENVTAGDAIIFGHFYGECLGEGCIEIYQLTETVLSEDILDQYPRSDQPYEGNFVMLSEKQFSTAVGLRDRIPGKLLLNGETVIGSPDAGDWGGIYFEIKVGSERRFWLIDQIDDHIPDYLVPFKNEINEVIKSINS